ncbi:hypothetical protein KG089_05295 [Carnobacteriaceae bacterium zg-ZUI252]|nr:hypothetical protein [Carnobacteriaceae bacterium zg-ZUI252]
MTQQYNTFERELGWDDEIQQDAPEFVVLPEGIYQFTVTGFERARHTPNAQNPGKLPACNKAIVSIDIETEQGTARLKHNLFLHSSTEGMLSAFFAAIGQKKKGAPLKMNWNTITGTKGFCKVGKRVYNGNEYNDVKTMYYPEEVDKTKVLNLSTPQQTQQTYQAPPQQNYSAPFGGFTPGA